MKISKKVNPLSCAAAAAAIAMPQFLRSTTASHRRLSHLHIRTFVNAKIKWARDPYLDTAVEREKNLKPLHSLKTLILSQPSQTLSLSVVCPLKPQLNLPTTAEKFIKDYPLIFRKFLPPNTANSLPHVKLTPRAISLHNDEVLLLSMSHYRRDVVKRVAKLLMLSGAGKLPLYLIDMFKYDLGLPHDYILTLLPEFPEYFQICDMGLQDSDDRVVFGLELVSWRDDLAVSEIMEKRRIELGNGRNNDFFMNLPRGFDLEKRVDEWMQKWQSLPYISPYENALHLAPHSDQAEKWVVGVIHELLCLLVSKKTERENIFCLGEFLGIGSMRIKKDLVHFPGIFYVSNKIRTQTVVLREAYIKNFLVEKHPLMGMRNRYISLMNLVLRRGKPIRNEFVGRRGLLASRSKVSSRKDDPNRMRRVEDNEN